MKITEYYEPPINWDQQLALAGSQAKFLQKTLWGNLIQIVDKAKPIFLEVRDSQELVASIMVFHRLPYDRNTGKMDRSPRSLLAGSYYGWLDFSGGPIFYDYTQAPGALRLILEWVADYSCMHKITLVEVGGLPYSYLNNEEIAEVLLSFGYQKQNWATFLVDLRKEEEALWMDLEHSGRKGVKKAQREGVCVERIDNWDAFVQKYYNPYRVCKEQDKQNVLPLSVMKQIWDHPSRNYYSYYVALDQNGKTLATLGMYIFDGIATEIMSALTADAFEKKIPAQDILHWEMFLEAKRMGCHTFDMAGVNPNPANPKEEGILRFKKKWGGSYVEYFQYRKESISFIRKAIIEIRDKVLSRGFR